MGISWKKLFQFFLGNIENVFPFFLWQEVVEKSLTVQLVEMIRQKTLGKVHLYKQMEIGGKTLGVYIPYGSEEMGQNNDPLSSQAVF